MGCGLCSNKNNNFTGHFVLNVFKQCSQRLQARLQTTERERGYKIKNNFFFNKMNNNYQILVVGNYIFFMNLVPNF